MPPTTLRIAVIGEKIPAHPEHLLAAIKQVCPQCQVEFAACTPEDTGRPEIAAAEVVYLLPVPRLDVSLLARMPNLRWIHTGMAGVENLLEAGIGRLPVLLTNGAGVHAPPIAEHVMAMILAFARRLPELYRQQERRQWQWLPAGEIAGQTVGILGFGGIGHEVARKARALGMRVLAFRRRGTPGPDADADYVYCGDDPAPVLAEADFVVMALPLTAATQGFLDARRFALMKPASYFINVGRGGTVVEADLIDALQRRVIAGAGLDVFADEPLPPESPLWDMPNVIISPHMSASTPHSQRRNLDLFCRNLQRYVAGEPLVNVVDVHAGY